MNDGCAGENNERTPTALVLPRLVFPRPMLKTETKYHEDKKANVNKETRALPTVLNTLRVRTAVRMRDKIVIVVVQSAMGACDIQRSEREAPMIREAQ
jgi:hypothetical protein